MNTVARQYIKKVVNGDYHLSRLLRFVENQFYDEDKEFFNKKRAEIANLANENEMGEFDKQEKAHTFTKIVLLDELPDSDELKAKLQNKPHGITYLFAGGAKIIALKNRESCEEHVIQHAIVAHECGHLLLHTITDEDTNKRVFIPHGQEDPEARLIFEIQASYFAEQYLRSMDDFDGIDDRGFSDEDKEIRLAAKNKRIRDAINFIHTDSDNKYPYDLRKIGIEDDMLEESNG